MFRLQLLKCQIKSQENFLFSLCESVTKTSLLALVSASLFFVDPALAFKVQYNQNLIPSNRVCVCVSVLLVFVILLVFDLFFYGDVVYFEGGRSIWSRSDKGSRSYRKGLQWQDFDQARLQNGLN